MNHLNSYKLIIFFITFNSFPVLCQDYRTNDFLENLNQLLSSDRFQKNILINKNGIPVKLESIIGKTDWNLENYSIDFTKELIKWVISDSTGDTFNLEYPNDFTLFYGKDKKELQDDLIHKLNLGIDLHRDSFCPEINGDVQPKILNDKLGALKVQYFINNHCEIVYAKNKPLESIVNLFMFRSNCASFQNLLLKSHLYGYQVDEIEINPIILSEFLGTENFNIWSYLEDESLFLYMEHSYLGYSHMLMIYWDKKLDTLSGDFYSFIPNNNVSDLFPDFNLKEDRLKIKIE